MLSIKVNKYSINQIKKVLENDNLMLIKADKSKAIVTETD
jgi:hypothetical protein